MVLSPRDAQRKQDAYARGESDDLTGLPESTVEHLKAARAEREELRKAYEEAQAKRAEDLARATFIDSGGTQVER